MPTNTADNTMIAAIRYVQRESAPSSEKGYILHYAAPKNFPQNNFTISSYSHILVQNLRISNLTWNDHGMKIASLENCSQWQPQDFDDDDWIERVYLPELHSCLCKALGAKDITIFDWMLRKRSVSFPKRPEQGEDDGSAQPSLSVHIGELL